MKRIEYKTQDRSQWGPGEWDGEPDKIQWKDEATGLPCLMVRNHGGAWCGYVGISEGHPLFGIGYSDAAKLPKETLARMLEARGVGELYADNLEKNEVHVESILDAHGGITFSDFCGTHEEADWQAARGRVGGYKAEAERYPHGDAARWLREWLPVMNDFGAWKDKCQAVGICHLPEQGEPERVWWFGFDCSHSGDISPGYDFSRRFGVATYKGVPYVRTEVEKLAAQLIGIA